MIYIVLDIQLQIRLLYFLKGMRIAVSQGWRSQTPEMVVTEMELFPDWCPALQSHRMDLGPATLFLWSSLFMETV